MMFRVGQRVVCVRGDGDCDPRPTKGHVYTIVTIRWLDFCIGEPGYGVTLVELPTIETDDYYAEFHADRFRPIVERKTDISIFTKMLTGNRENINA